MAIVHLSAFLDPKTRERALQRIGYYDHTKKRGRQVDYRRLLDWFVALSRKNLVTLRPEKLRELHEEVRAIQREGSGDFIDSGSEASTAAELPKTQTKVAEYLGHLAKTGRIGFETFSLSCSIWVPRFDPRYDPQDIPASFKTHYTTEFVDPYHGKDVLFLFFLALKGAGDRLRRCPYCEILFVQARRKQRVCTPLCRVRDWRTRQQKEREQKKTSRRLRQKKGAKQHGRKTHR